MVESRFLRRRPATGGNSTPNMKTYLHGIALSLISAIAFAGGDALYLYQVKDRLQDTLHEFHRLAEDVSYAHLPPDVQGTLRSKFQSARETLHEAIKKVLDNPEEAKALAILARTELRRFSMMGPFCNNVWGRCQESLIERFILTEDKLLAGIRLLEAPQTPPTPPPANAFWLGGGFLWKPLVGKRNYNAAMTACRDEGMELPKYDELVAVFREMRNPEKNSAFGKDASLYTYVWVSDEYEAKPGYFYAISTLR